MQNPIKAPCLIKYGKAEGQTHCTLSGVSPHPSASLPSRRRTPILTLAQVTCVNVSVPNFNGTRVLTGRK